MTLKAIHAALKRYFQDTRGIDIIQDKEFMRPNKLFLGLLKENKIEGRGKVTHKETLTDEDKKKLFKYFKEKMKNPDAKVLQQMCIFNIVYYMGCRG